MKRINISKFLSSRIEELMLENGAANKIIGRSEPYVASEVTIDVRSLLGRFLTRKGMVDKSLCTDFDGWRTIINVHLEKRSGRTRLRLLSVSV